MNNQENSYFLSEQKIPDVETPDLLFKDNVPYLPEFVVNNMKSYFRQHWKDLIFRRVNGVNFKDVHLEKVLYYKDPKTVREIPVSEIKKTKFTLDELERNVVFYYNRFTFTTEPNSIRDNDKFPHQEIFVTADSYADLNISTLFFEEKTRLNKIPPKVGDLVCMLVEKPTNPRHNPRAKKYFICSEQFLRAWTCVMYDNHPAFRKRKEPKLRTFLMSGNRLNTNTLQKLYLAHKDHNITMDKNLFRQRFFFLRTEGLSKKYVHAYTDLVLMVKYGELPCSLNVPANIDGEYMLHHNSPKNWLDFILGPAGYNPEKYHGMTWVALDKMMHRKADKIPHKINYKHKRKNFVMKEESFPLLDKNNYSNDTKKQSDLLDKKEIQNNSQNSEDCSSITSDFVEKDLDKPKIEIQDDQDSKIIKSEISFSWSDETFNKKKRNMSF